jgi:hypothetical protein
MLAFSLMIWLMAMVRLIGVKRLAVAMDSLNPARGTCLHPFKGITARV